MGNGTLLAALAGVVGYHELACRGLLPWVFGTTPPACWVPVSGAGCPQPYSPQLQAMLAQNPGFLGNAAEFRTYACSLGLNPGLWGDLETYFIDHAYSDPGGTAPPEWPSVACFGPGCLV